LAEIIRIISTLYNFALCWINKLNKNRMLKLLEKMYHYLPLFAQNIAISLFGIHWFNRRYGGIFKKELEKCRTRENYTASQWLEYQTTYLRKLLLHANNTVPYYQNLFANLELTNVKLENFTLDQLKMIPVLEKDTFRRLGTTELLSTKLEPNCKFYSSSGSTGTPTRNLYSISMHQRYFAIVESRIHEWAGLNYKMPRGMIGGRRIIKDGNSNGPYYRYNYIEKQTYFSAYHLSPETTPNYLKGIVDNNVKYMSGYASANFFLARFIEESKLKAPKLKAMVLSSEKLTKEMRDTFRRVYGCESFDSYNGVEATCLISECEHHRLHIVPDVGIVEVVNEKGLPCKPGEQGEVITTGLLNFNQPLIRYRMGDIITLSKDQTCKCGREMPLVDEIVGRVEDTVIGPDGREMVRFHGIYYDIPSIVEGQIIQHSLTNFELKVVVSNNLSEADFGLLKKRMLSQLGEINIEINVVDSIPRTSNGKFKAVISNVKRNFIN